jgi:radical SAM superfamily enzyme YgiQ (UPF0313 family)
MRLPLPAASVRVLLINLNSYDQPYPVYPLGIAYVDGALREAGHETRVWDARMTKQSLEETIAAFAPQVVGVSMRNIDNVQQHNPRSFVQDAIDCCARVRASTDAVLVIGGSAFSVFPQELFDATGVDFGIQGEGELAFIELIEHLQRGEAVDLIAGLVHRSAAGATRWLPANPKNAVFSSEPHHLPDLLSAYAAEGSLPGVQTQRGCPLRCCYCTYPLIEGKKSRYRTGEEIVAEMKALAAMGVKYTFIVDSVFNTRADHVAAICEALVEADTGVSWECFLRPRNVSRELLVLMKRAGMRHVEFGSDSFSDPVLKRYGKSFTYDEILTISQYAHELGLHYSHFLIFGGPGETEETIAQTLERATQLPGAYYFATIGMRIYPATPLWREINPEANGETPADYLRVPRFYLSPGLDGGRLFERLSSVRAEHPNWVIGDPPPSFVATISKLRKRGVQGPAWEYIEFLQRMQGASGESAAGAMPAVGAR